MQIRPPANNNAFGKGNNAPGKLNKPQQVANPPRQWYSDGLHWSERTPKGRTDPRRVAPKMNPPTPPRPPFKPPVGAGGFGFGAFTVKAGPVILATAAWLGLDLLFPRGTVTRQQEREALEKARSRGGNFSIDAQPPRVIQEAVYPFIGGQSPGVMYRVRWTPWDIGGGYGGAIMTIDFAGPLVGFRKDSKGYWSFVYAGGDGWFTADTRSESQNLSLDPNWKPPKLLSVNRLDGLPDTGGNPPATVAEIKTAPTYNIVNNVNQSRTIDSSSTITTVINQVLSPPPSPSNFPPNPAAVPDPSSPTLGRSPIGDPGTREGTDKDNSAENENSLDLRRIVARIGFPVGSYGNDLQRITRVDDPLDRFAIVTPTPAGGFTTTPRTTTTTTTTTGTSIRTSTGTTTTSPPDKGKMPTPQIPPLFNPVPTINNPNTTDKPFENKTPPPPVTQEPAGNNCCYATPLRSDIGQVNKKLDAVNPALQALDLSLLGVINGKLGPQVPGGLSTFLGDKFTKLWNSRVIDRALNVIATVAAIHNAVMLSRNIGGTLIQALANGLAIIGIKDADDRAYSFGEVIGDGVENIVKSIVGEANYTTLSETWARANRIYQSAINVYQLLTDSMSGIAEGLEQSAKYTGKIGNALRKSGEVLEGSYEWMSEKFNFRSGKLGAIDRVIRGLNTANQVASDLESITGNFREVTENVSQISTEINSIRTEIQGKETEKKTAEDAGKTNSQSPAIAKANLIKPEA